LRQFFETAVTVAGSDIHQDHIRLLLLNHSNGIFAVFGFSNDLEARLAFQDGLDTCP